MAELVLSINNTVSGHALPTTVGNNRRVVTDDGSSRWVRISSTSSFDIELADVTDDAAAGSTQRYTAGVQEVYIGRGEFGVSGVVADQSIDITLIENQSASFLASYDTAVHRLLPANAITTRNPNVTIDSLDEDPVTGWITLGYTAAAAQSNPDNGITWELPIVDAFGASVSSGKVLGPTGLVVEIDPAHKGNWAVGAMVYGTTNAAGIGPGMQCDGTDFGAMIARDAGALLTATAFFSDAVMVAADVSNNSSSDSAVRGIGFHLFDNSRTLLARSQNITSYSPNPWDRWGLYAIPLAAETATVRFRVSTVHMQLDTMLDLAAAP